MSVLRAINRQDWLVRDRVTLRFNLSAALGFATKGMKMNDVKPESSSASVSPAGGNNNNNNNNNNINGNGKASATAAAAAAAAVTANGGEGISAAVAKVLQGYDWTLVPVATK